MGLFNKREVKIFLTFFFIYSFFIHWIGSNEISRFSLTRTIVDEGRFEIDSYYNQTGDRSFFENHYYSDKEPGVSFLSVPIYAVWKYMYYNFFPKSFIQNHTGSNATVLDLKVGMNEVPIYLYIKPGFFVLFSMVILTIFTSSLFGSLLTVLIYKISKYFTKNEKNRLIITFVAGFGTLIFPYSIVFFDHIVATFFTFFVFYLLFKAKHEKINKNKHYILAGLLFGYAIVCSAITFIIAFALWLYLFSFNRKKLFYFTLCGFIGLLPLLLYNYSIFGTSFTLPRHHLDTTIWSEIHIQGLHVPNPSVILRLLIYPYKGLFFYYPVLIFSLIGLYYMYKKFKIESILITFVFFAFLIFNAFWYAWWGGASFGARHLTPIIPFLSIPFLYFIIKKENSRFVKSLIALLAIFSIFINFSGLQYISDEVIDNNSLLLKNEFAQKMKTLSILENPIYDYYIPRFLKFGPRSLLFENIVNGEEPDIRYVFYEKGDVISQFFFYFPFMNILPVVLIFLIVWNRELFRSLNFVFKNRSKTFLLALLILFCIFLVYLIMPKEIFIPSEIKFESGWFPVDQFGIRWMRQDGIVKFYNNETEPKFMHISMISNSYYRDRDLRLFLNGEIIETETVKSDNPLRYNFFVKFRPGKNTLKFHTTPDCDIGVEVGESEVKDCKSIYVKNLTIEEPEDLIFYKNWYEASSLENIEWMNQDGTIIVLNDETQLKNLKLYFGVRAFYSERNIKFYLNDQLIDEFTVFLENSEVYTSTFSLHPGINFIKFHSQEDCTVIGEIIGNEDKRCLTIGLNNISLLSSKDINETILFNYNFYPYHVEDKATFIKQNGMVTIISPNCRNSTIYLNLTTFESGLKTQLYLNDELIETLTINKIFTDYKWDEFYIPVTLKSRENVLKFQSLNDCTIIKDVLKNEDRRCVTIGIRKIEISQ